VLMLCASIEVSRWPLTWHTHSSLSAASSPDAFKNATWPFLPTTEQASYEAFPHSPILRSLVSLVSLPSRACAPKKNYERSVQTGCITQVSFIRLLPYPLASRGHSVDGQLGRSLPTKPR
jgi:hypothetical protein